VSQPIQADQDPTPEPDPLLAFFAEDSEAAGSLTGDAAASPENPAAFAHFVRPVEPVERHHQVSEELLLRVDRAERLAERSLLEIATLKTDLATLVSAVEDIKKLQSRRDVPAEPAARPPIRRPLWRAALAVVVLLSFTTLGWGLATAVSVEEPAAPPIESESEPAAAAPPIVDAAPPPADTQKAATVLATPTAPAPRDDPPPRPASRTPTVYVGTLSIDSSPAGEVFVNRQSAGRTPLRLDKLRAGSHLIWIEREGYRRWTRVVAVAANRVSRVSATLDPISR
jgi:hypothetical protein